MKRCIEKEKSGISASLEVLRQANEDKKRSALRQKYTIVNSKYLTRQKSAAAVYNFYLQSTYF